MPPPPLPAPPPAPPGPRRLLRRGDGEQKIGGVCAGIADHLGVDVTLVRIAAVVLAFAGPGLPAYVLLWVVMPEAPPGTPPNPVRHGPMLDGGTNPVIGVALLLAAVVVVFDGGVFDEGLLLPLLLIGGGAWLLLRDRDGDARPPGAGWPAPPAASTSPVGSWSGSTAAAQSSMGQDDPTSQLGSVGPAGAPPTRPWEHFAPTTPQPTVPRQAEEPRSPLGRLVVGALALGGALLWALAAADVVDPDAGDVLALGVIGIGTGLLVGARYGRARWLILPGLVLVAALTAVSAVDVPLRGGFGDRRHEPLSAADLEEPFRLTAGEMVIDLRSLEPTADQATVTASIGAGSLQVEVPEGVTIVLHGEAAAGQVVFPGSEQRRERDGIGVDEQVTLRGDEGAGTVELDLEVVLGEVVVTRG